MKVYNESETADILKLAAQGSELAGHSEGLGLTKEELEEVASESGIDPAEIGKAIHTLESQSPPASYSFWGGPFAFSDHGVVDHEISEAEWETMLEPIREFFKSKGEIQTREHVYEWHSPWGTTNSAHVTALKRDGKTRISVGWSGPLTAVPFYIPVPLVGIASLFFASEFMGLGAVPGMIFVVASMGLTFATGKWALHRNLDKGFAKLRQLSASLQAMASSEAERPPVQVEAAVAEPAMKMDVDEVESVAGEESRTRLRE